MNIKNLIENSNKVLIVGHVRPDGDCFGAGLSLLKVCEKLGKKAHFVCDSDLSLAYSFMSGYEKVNQFEKDDYDLLIAVDCGDSARMGGYKDYLKKVKTTVNIDHHITNNGFAAINHVMPQASSTCQVIFELLEKENCIDEEIASLLFVGLSTDTGHFMHNTVTADVFRIAAKLIDFGVDSYEITNKLYKSRSISKTKLIVRAIQSMRFFHDKEICIITISSKDFKECECVLSDTEGLIDYAMGIAGVKVAACLAEQKDKVFKVGLRSKGINVSNVAGFFGGGGHTRASGCMLNGFYEDVIDKLQKAIVNEIESSHY